MDQRRKRQVENERRDRVGRTERPRIYSVSAATGTFHLRWLEYIKKRHDPTIGGLRMA